MKNLKKYLVFILGTLLFAFGISFGNRSLFGGNSMAILVVGISLHLPVSMGTCNLLVSVLEILIGTMMDKSHTSLVSIITMFISSYAIDLANLIIPPVDSLQLRLLYMVAGIICYCLGLGTQQACEIGYGNLDIFIFGFKKKYNVKNYRTIRWPIDIAFIALGMLLGAPVGIGTLFLMFFAGVLIEKSKALTIELFFANKNK